MQLKAWKLHEEKLLSNKEVKSNRIEWNWMSFSSIIIFWENKITVVFLNWMSRDY